ncbi:MAG: response regulator transcription factor [Actinomycetota bacterium]
MRILVVEDEEKVSAFIKAGLEQSGYTVDVAPTGEGALRVAVAAEYGTVVLDMMLPGIGGLDVVRELRRRKVETPVVALTARGELDDRIAGLEAGCDDYLAKPFAFEELLARVRALQRRATSARSANLSYRDLTLDTATRVAVRGSARMELTNKEYALLEYLLRRPEQVLTRAELLEHVWGYDFETPSNVLEVYMNFLRKKIDSKHPRKLLHTVRGVGYVLREEE